MKALAYNVAALDKVLGLAAQVGDSYKPGNMSIERTALTSLLEESRKSVTAVLKAEGDLASAINRRQEAFETLPSMGSQISALAASCGMDSKDLEDLNRIRKYFRSQPFKVAPKKATSGEPQTSASSADARRKNRQLSFDNKVVIFESMIRFLEEHPLYHPNEAQFTIEGLKERLESLKALNSAINEAKSQLTNVRAQAKGVIFNKKNGVFGRARMTRQYLKAVLGGDNDLYKSISKVKFKEQA
jgi:hypothetical protein